MRSIALPLAMFVVGSTALGFVFTRLPVSDTAWTSVSWFMVGLLTGRPLWGPR
jgi:hypothetical protein